MLNIRQLIDIFVFSESAESSAVEEMVVQLFELVNEKNELFRRRSELVNMYVLQIFYQNVRWTKKLS